MTETMFDTWWQEDNIDNKEWTTEGEWNWTAEELDNRFTQYDACKRRADNVIAEEKEQGRLEDFSEERMDNLLNLAYDSCGRQLEQWLDEDRTN